MGPTYLAWALSLLGDTSTVDLASGAELMVRGGAMAVVPNEAPRPAVEYSLTTLSGIRISSGRTTFTLRYRPLTYYQTPNIADADRPLYLHRLDGAYSTALNPLLNFSWSGEARVGDVTYASLARTFDDGTAAAAAARLPLLFLSTGVTAGYATSTRNVVNVGANVSYRTVMNTLLDKEEAQIPETLNLGITVGDTVTLTRKDQFGVALGATYSQTETVVEQRSGDAVFGTALANWNHQHSVGSASTFTAGAGASRNVESGPTNLFPVVSAAHTDSYRWWGDAFSSSVSGGIRGFVDPVLATIRPQAFLSLGLTGQHTRAFSTQAQLAAWTSLTDAPVEPAQYESSGSFNFTGAYTLNPNLSFRAGVSYQLRAPHLSDLDALAIQPQPTVFVALRGRLGTDRNRGSWL